MKDLVDIFEMNERRFFGTDDQTEKRCSYCRDHFYTSDLEPVGEQVIRGKYVRNASACHFCLPLVPEED